jgi:hypothetical protein
MAQASRGESANHDRLLSSAQQRNDTFEHGLMYDCPKMQRALSICLIFFFGFGPLSAAFQPNDDSRLPACCRRHGAHHCAMSDSMMTRMAGSASGTQFLTAPSHCPLYPNGGFVPNAPVHALARYAEGLPTLLAQGHSPAATRAAARMSQLRTRSDRGPPVSNLG